MTYTCSSSWSWLLGPIPFRAFLVLGPMSRTSRWSSIQLQEIITHPFVVFQANRSRWSRFSRCGLVQQRRAVVRRLTSYRWLTSPGGAVCKENNKNGRRRRPHIIAVTHTISWTDVEPSSFDGCCGMPSKRTLDKCQNPILKHCQTPKFYSKC